MTGGNTVVVLSVRSADMSITSIPGHLLEIMIDLRYKASFSSYAVIYSFMAISSDTDFSPEVTAGSLITSIIASLSHLLYCEDAKQPKMPICSN